MICGRRRESVHGMNRKGEDHWRSDNTCSYCGSLNPDELMKRIEEKTIELGPTDKSYKIYLQNKAGPKLKQSYRKDCDMGKPGSKCTGPDDCVHWVTEEQDHGKFYFQHLSEEQMKRFVDLYNDQTIKCGYPGYFYVNPFFMKSASSAETKTDL